MEAVSVFAATCQISQQVGGIISAARTAYKDFKSAAEDHKKLSTEFASILKIIEFTGDVLERAARRLTDEGLKNALKDDDIESLLGGIRKSIEDAQKILDKHKDMGRWDKIRFAMGKGALLGVQARLSNAGIHLSMFLTSLLVDGVAGGASQAPLKELLTHADVKESMKEALESVKEEINRDIQGKAKDSDDTTRTNSEQSEGGAAKQTSGFSLRKYKSSMSLRRSKNSRKPRDQVQRHPSTVSGSEIESRPQTAPADPVPVSATDASSPTSTSKDQEVHQGGSVNEETQAESSCDILEETRISSLHVSDEFCPSSPAQSPEAGLETPSDRTSSGSAPQNATRDGATQTSPILTPFTEPEEDEEMPSSSMDMEELPRWRINRYETSSSEASGGTCLTRRSLSTSSREPLQPPYGINLALERSHGFLMPGKTLEGLEEAVFRRRRRRSSDTPTNAKQALFANTTWISASTIGACGEKKDEEGDDDETHGVLVFQRPDNWLQLAVIPRDHLKPASLLCPIVEAIENTPVYSHAKCHGDHRRGLLAQLSLASTTARNTFDHRRILRIYFFRGRAEGPPQLFICTISFAPTLINATWDIQKLHVSSGDDLPPPMPGMGFFNTERMNTECLSYASSLGSLVTLQETSDGNWQTLPYPKEFLVQPGDLVIHTKEDDSLRRYIWRYFPDSVSRTEILNGISWASRFFPPSYLTTTQQARRRGLTSDESLISCLPIYEYSLIGMVCKTLDNDIYLFKIHSRQDRRELFWSDTWQDRYEEPVHICKVKSGTNISLSGDSRDLFFISTNNELKRIRIQVQDSGKITFTQPSALFPKDASSTRLDVFSFPEIIIDEKPSSEQDDESSTYSYNYVRGSVSSSSLNLGSNSAGSTASHRTTAED